MEELNLDVAGEYIYEAALLIHLKSKMLLPRPRREDGSEIEDDPRQELVERLLEYRRLKEVAQSLAEVDRLRQGIWTREAPDARPRPARRRRRRAGPRRRLALRPAGGAQGGARSATTASIPPPYHLGRESFSVRGQLHRLLEVMGRGRPYDLLADLRTRSCRAEAVAAFLAVLELARLNLVRVHQTEGGELLLYRTTRDLTAEEMEAVEA